MVDLSQFFGCYFHQDWPEEFGDWRPAVHAFRRNNTEVVVADVVSELQQFIASSATEREIEDRLLHELGCYYTPRPDLGGPTFREWLSQVCAELQSPLPR